MIKFIIELNEDEYHLEDKVSDDMLDIINKYGLILTTSYKEYVKPKKVNKNESKM